jgi:hypothetical protein
MSKAAENKRPKAKTRTQTYTVDESTEQRIADHLDDFPYLLGKSAALRDLIRLGREKVKEEGR